MTPYYRSNEFRVKYAIKHNLIRSYEARDFNKWLYHTIDEYLDKVTVSVMASDFNKERYGEY